MESLQDTMFFIVVCCEERGRNVKCVGFRMYGVAYDEVQPVVVRKYSVGEDFFYWPLKQE